jgi:hypothetical protein
VSSTEEALPPLYDGSASSLEDGADYFFRSGRWVNAEPAAVFAALLALGSRNTLEAAEAAFLLVTSRFFFIQIYLYLGHPGSLSARFIEIGWLGKENRTKNKKS